MNGTRRVTIRGLIVLAVVGSGLAAFASPVNGAGDDAASGSAALVINTVPPLPGVRFAVDGRTFTSGADGVARITVTTGGNYITQTRQATSCRQLAVTPKNNQDPAPFRDVCTTRDHQYQVKVPRVLHTIAVLDSSVQRTGLRAAFSRWCCSVNEDDHGDKVLRNIAVTGEPFQAAFEVSYLTRPVFSDLEKRTVPIEKVTSITLKGSHGAVATFDPRTPQWLLGIRPVTSGNSLIAKNVQWSVEDVIVRGATVVNRSEQRFLPRAGATFGVAVQLHSIRISAHDALFHMKAGKTLVIEYPDGHTERFALGSHREVIIPALPRGTYQMKVLGPGHSLKRSVAVSGDQDVSIPLFTYVDIAAVLAVLLGALLSLALIGRAIGRRGKKQEPAEIPLPANDLFPLAGR